MASHGEAVLLHARHMKPVTCALPDKLVNLSHKRWADTHPVISRIEGVLRLCSRVVI
jgi:hypothetical protein